jgi:hypothetical protein
MEKLPDLKQLSNEAKEALIVELWEKIQKLSAILATYELKRFAAALRVLSFGMDWCYLDTSFNFITFVVLSAREICRLGFGELGRGAVGQRI